MDCSIVSIIVYSCSLRDLFGVISIIFWPLIIPKLRIVLKFRYFCSHALYEIFLSLASRFAFAVMLCVEVAM